MATKKPYKRKNKNTIRDVDMNQMAYQYFEGIDLMAIEGVNDATIMAISKRDRFGRYQKI